MSKALQIEVLERLKQKFNDGFEEIIDQIASGELDEEDEDEDEYDIPKRTRSVSKSKSKFIDEEEDPDMAEWRRLQNNY